MTYKKSEARWEEPEGITVPLERRGQPAHRVMCVVGHRAEALALVNDLLDLLAKHDAYPPCGTEVHDDGTLRTQSGNVIAACADRQTAALIGIVLHRFEGVTSDEDPLPFTPWKGPYQS